MKVFFLDLQILKMIFITGASLWNLWNILEQIFYRTPPGKYFNLVILVISLVTVG